MILRQMTKIHLKRKQSRTRRMLNLEQINCELLNQDIAEVKLDKLKKVEGDKNGVHKLPSTFKILKRFQVILQPLMKVLK